jgi:hypothetical protein
MKIVRYRIRKLNKSQKDILDCHYIIKNRYLFTGVIESEVEFANYRKHYRLQVLPREDAYQHDRYFNTDFPCNQSWERPSHYHFIGEVDFLGTTTYCDEETKNRLSTAGYTTRPNINYRYRNTRGKVEAVSEYWLSEITKRVKRERKVRRAWRNLQGENYVDPYLTAQTDSTTEESDTEESDMDENPRVLENSDTEEETATVSDTSQATVVQPSVPEEQPVTVTRVIETASQAQQTEPGDYVTQDEETYQHYYSARGLSQAKEEVKRTDTKSDI